MEACPILLPRPAQQMKLIMCRKKEVAPAENDAHSTDLFTHRSENDKSDGRKEGAVGKTKSERLDTMDLSLPGYIWILT